MPNTIRLILDKNGFPEKREFSDHYYWIFLGRDYKRLLELKKEASANWHYIDIGDHLEKVSHELRRPYLDYIGDLSTRFASLAWWCSKVSEKNVMDSPVFLYICYLEVVKRLKESLQEKNICIFSESPAVLESMSRSDLFNDHQKIRLYNNNVFKAYLIGLVRLLLSVRQCFVRKLWARLTVKYDNAPISSASPPLTILRTWVGDKNLGQDGKFKDSYFAGLADELRAKRKTVAVLPIFYNLKRSIKEAFIWLREADGIFIIADDYYRISDYFRGIYVLFRSLSFFKGSFLFEGHDLKLIYQAEARRTAFLGGSALDVVMHHYLPKRLNEAGIKIDNIIITFENMFPEKPIILGVEKYLSGSKVFGFQHASLFPLLLSCYSSKKETEVLPMPDKIICSGNYFKKILFSEGFPMERLIDGPALRFQYLTQDNKPVERPKNSLLVTLPLAKPNALELLSKTWSAVSKNKKLKLLIKPHPMMTDGELSEVIELVGISESDYKIVGGGMNDVLPKATMVIATASATIFDALAFGVPAIRVRSDLDISLDPMDWFPKDDLQFTARTPEEIADEIEKIMSLNDEKIAELHEKGRELIGNCFSPVNEKTLAAFI